MIDMMNLKVMIVTLDVMALEVARRRCGEGDCVLPAYEYYWKLNCFQGPQSKDNNDNKNNQSDDDDDDVNDGIMKLMT